MGQNRRRTCDYMQPSAGKSTDRRRELLFLRWYECITYIVLLMSSRKLKSSAITKGAATFFADWHTGGRVYSHKSRELFDFAALSFMPTFLAQSSQFFSIRECGEMVLMTCQSVYSRCTLHGANVCVWFSLAASDIFASAGANQVTLKRGSWLASLFVLFTCGERGNQVWWMHFTHIKLLCHISTLSTSANVFFMKVARCPVKYHQAF